jgi:hypothetical protein
VIKAPSVWRRDDAPAARRVSLERWLRRIERPEYVAEWNELVTDAIRRSAVKNSMWTVRHERTLRELEATVGQQAQQLEVLRSTQLASALEVEGLVQSLQRADDRTAAAEAELAAIMSSRTWRLRNTLVDVALLRTLFARRCPS